MVNPTPDNAERVLQALADFGFGSVNLVAADVAVPGRIVQLGYPPNRIDILTSIAGLTFEQAWEGRVEGRFGAVNVPYLGKAELIVNKRSVGRPQDLADLDALERTD